MATGQLVDVAVHHIHEVVAVVASVLAGQVLGDHDRAVAAARAADADGEVRLALRRRTAGSR